MIRNLLLPFFFIFCVQTALSAAEEKSSDNDSIIKGSILATAGTKRGMLYEYVFSRLQKESELDWQMHSCRFAGLSADITVKNGLWISGNFAYGLNDRIGYIRDYDWDSSGSLYEYHRHSNNQERAFFLDVSSGWVFSPYDLLRLIPFAGVDIYDIQMTARDGYEQAPGSARADMYGTIMKYRQKYVIPYAGARGEYSFGNFSFAAWGKYGCFGRCEAVDQHLWTAKEYHDEMKFVQQWESGISADYIFADCFILRVETSFLFIPQTKGDDYYIDTSSGTRSAVYKNTAGIKMKMWTVSLSAGVKL